MLDQQARPGDSLKVSDSSAYWINYCFVGRMGPCKLRVTEGRGAMQDLEGRRKLINFNLSCFLSSSEEKGCEAKTFAPFPCCLWSCSGWEPTCPGLYQGLSDQEALWSSADPSVFRHPEYSPSQLGPYSIFQEFLQTSSFSPAWLYKLLLSPVYSSFLKPLGCMLRSPASALSPQVYSIHFSPLERKQK